MNSKNPEVEKTLNSIMKAREALFKKEKERLLSDEAKHLQRAHVFDLDPEKDKDLILTGVFMVQNIMGLCINKLKLAPLESISLTTFTLMILGDCMGKGFKRVDIIKQLVELDLL